MDLVDIISHVSYYLHSWAGLKKTDLRDRQHAGARSMVVVEKMFSVETKVGHVFSRKENLAIDLVSEPVESINR